jgi:hypothetical protein
MADKFDAFFAEVSGDVLFGKWTAKRANSLAKTLVQRGTPRALASFFFEDSAARYFVQFAPRMAGERLIIDLVQTRIHGRQRPLPTGVALLEVMPHAVERLFQRLNTVDHAAMQEELLGGLMLVMPLKVSSDALGLRQAAIPTKHGAFICQCDGHDKWIAHTWIQDGDARLGNDMSRRWAQVVGAIRAVALQFAKATKQGDVSCRFAAVGGNMGDMGIDRVATVMTAALRPFHWLKEPYVPRADHRDEAWGAAQAQLDSKSVKGVQP